MIGVKKFIEEFKTPFNREAKALAKAKRILSKEYTKPTKEQIEEEKLKILGEWERKTDRGVDYQQKLCVKESKNNPNVVLETRFKNEELIDIQDFKSVCKLENGKTYLEKFLCSKKYGILGYADKIAVKRSAIDITDNKVVDKIYRTGNFKTSNGFKVEGEKMFPPLNHLYQCNYNDFVLQLSLLMYLAWENNKHLKIGKLYINHVKMNDSDKILDTELIEVPYMKEEVIKMLKYKKLNDE